MAERQNVKTTTRSTDQLGPVDVQIQGQTLTVRSDHDREFVERLAGYIDGKLGELKQAAPHMPTDKLLMMASLTVAEELFEAKSEIDDLRDEVGERAEVMRKLLAQIEEG